MHDPLAVFVEDVVLLGAVTESPPIVLIAVESIPGSISCANAGVTTGEKASKAKSAKTRKSCLPA